MRRLLPSQKNTGEKNTVSLVDYVKALLCIQSDKKELIGPRSGRLWRVKAIAVAKESQTTSTHADDK
jgi:hypothetical protein